MTYSEIDKITSKIKEIAQEILLKKPLRYSELDEIPSTQGI